MSDSYVDRQLLAIQNELTELQLTYDTKYLATAMMQRAVHMLRMLHTAGRWRVEDVQAVVQGALVDVYEPLPQQPRMMTKDDPTR